MNDRSSSLLSALVLVTALVVAGCQANQALVKPCCYVGEVTLATLAELELVGADGKHLAFTDAFPGYRRSNAALLLAPPPLEDFYIDVVAYAPLARALAPHDWNRNGRLEEPELTSFYLWESARGLGHPLREVRRAGMEVGALQTTVADLATLLSYVNAHRERMLPETLSLFRHVEYEAKQQRIQNLGGGETPRGG